MRRTAQVKTLPAALAELPQPVGVSTKTVGGGGMCCFSKDRETPDSIYGVGHEAREFLGPVQDDGDRTLFGSGIIYRPALYRAHNSVCG